MVCDITKRFGHENRVFSLPTSLAIHLRMDKQKTSIKEMGSKKLFNLM